MRILLVISILLISTIILNAQKAPVKFGDVSIDQIKMKMYPKDSSAAAVILVDYGQSTIEYNQIKGFQLVYERITRIKVLTKDGLEWGDFSIPLYHDGADQETLSGLKGVTYNLENGKVVESKLKGDGQFKEKFDNNLDYVKFSMPNVKEGCVIEVSYRILSDFIFNFQDWEFQSRIPTVWSEYRANIPEYFGYDKFMQGYLVLTTNEQTSSRGKIVIQSSDRSGTWVVQTTVSSDNIDYEIKNSRWIMENSPAFKPEPFITTPRDYISKINFELSYTKYPNQLIKNYNGSWEDVNKRYAESADFGGEVKGNDFLKKTAEEVIAGLTSEEEKIGAIHNYVRSNFTWDGTNRKFAETSLRKVFDDKKGSSAEINLLLASMLEKIGMDVSPVLISTRNHGFVRQEIAISSQFNYSICVVRLGEKTILLDATEKLLPTGLLPERCLNGKGLVVSKAGHQWVNLTTPLRSKSSISFTGTLTDQGSIAGKVTFDRSGYFAERDRKKYLLKGDAEYVKEKAEQYQIEMNESEFINAKELGSSFKETHSVSMTDKVSVASNLLYLNPMFLWKIDENPFRSEERKYPVDFGSSFEQAYFCQLKLPENYAIDELPQPKAIMLPGNSGKFTYSASVAGNTLNIVNSLQINKSVFVMEEYGTLREFYDQLVAKHAEQIVLKLK